MYIPWLGTGRSPGVILVLISRRGGTDPTETPMHCQALAILAASRPHIHATYPISPADPHEPMCVSYPTLAALPLRRPMHPRTPLHPAARMAVRVLEGRHSAAPCYPTIKGH